MKYLVKVTSNYWQTFRRKRLRPCSRKIMWWVIRLALLALRIVCKLIDYFGTFEAIENASAEDIAKVTNNKISNIIKNNTT